MSRRSRPRELAWLRQSSITRLFSRPQILLVGVLLLALFLRAYRLNDIPPGLYQDEAYNGVDAVRILQRGVFPVFFPANQGREALFIYLQTLAVAIWGARIWTLRLVAVMVGTVTIPLLYRLAKELFADRKYSRWLGLVAASGLTVSYWHLMGSRSGFRAYLLPALSIVAIWFMWRGSHAGGRRDWLVSGLALGAALNTYISARVLPLVLAAFVLFQVVLAVGGALRSGRLARAAHDLELRRRLVGMTILTLTALIITAPLGLFFATHPIELGGRAQALIVYDPFAPPSAYQGLWRLQENIVSVVRMFIDRGDAIITNNLPDRPTLDVLGVLGFWIGAVTAVVRIRRPVNLLLLIWLVVMLLPTTLSSDPPNFIRATGVLPPMFLLIAAGLASAWERVAGRMGWFPLVIGILVIGGIPTVRDYFLVWPSRPDTLREYDGGVVTSAQRVLDLAHANDVLMPLEIYGRPAPQYLLTGAFSSALPLTQPLVSARPVIYVTTDNNIVDPAVVLVHGGDQSEAVIPGLLDEQTVRSLKERLAGSDWTPVLDRAGARVAKAVLVSPPGRTWQPLAPSHSAGATLGGDIRLLGFDSRPGIFEPGSDVELVLYWQALHDIQQAYGYSVTLSDAKGKTWDHVAQGPWNRNYATDLWWRGQIIPERVRLHVPDNAPAGKYQAVVQFFRDNAPDVPLAVTDSAGCPPCDTAGLGPFTVGPADQLGHPPEHPLNMHFGVPAVISLTGYSLDSRLLVPGATVPLDLEWKAEGKIDADWTVFVHLLDRSGKIVAQSDGQPQDGYSPMRWWSAGEVVGDRHVLELPADAALAPWTLEIGLYDVKTGERLPVLNANGDPQPQDRVLIPGIGPAPRQ